MLHDDLNINNFYVENFKVPQYQTFRLNKINTLQYQEADPINIDGNTDFHNQAGNQGWDLNGQRDGSESAPYVIESFSFISSQITTTLIQIKNTDIYFEIRDCEIIGDQEYPGIDLDYTMNGNISHNNIFNCTNGITLSYSSDMVIENNYLTNNSVHAISLTNDSDRNQILNNTIIRNHMGIYIGTGESDLLNDLHYFPTSNEIYGNFFHYNSFGGVWISSSKTTLNRIVSNYFGTDGGIRFTHTANNFAQFNTFNWSLIYIYYSENITIMKNTVFNSSMTGITMENSVNAILKLNSVYNCGSNGILFVNTNNTKCMYNTIVYNGYKIDDYGVYLDSDSTLNSIRYNNFIGNNPEKPSQIYDEGESNTVSHNYWSDWTIPDDNTDGIVDDSYIVAGSANNKDQSPHVSLIEYQTSNGSNWSLFASLFSFLMIFVIRRRYRPKIR